MLNGMSKKVYPLIILYHKSNTTISYLRKSHHRMLISSMTFQKVLKTIRNAILNLLKIHPLIQFLPLHSLLQLLGIQMTRKKI